MNNLKSALTKNLKPYSKHIPDINKATLRSLLKREYFCFYIFNYFILITFSLCRFSRASKIFKGSLRQRSNKDISAEPEWITGLRYLLYNNHDSA